MGNGVFRTCGTGEGGWSPGGMDVSDRRKFSPVFYSGHPLRIPYGSAAQKGVLLGAYANADTNTDIDARMRTHFMGACIVA